MSNGTEYVRSLKLGYEALRRGDDSIALDFLQQGCLQWLVALQDTSKRHELQSCEVLARLINAIREAFEQADVMRAADMLQHNVVPLLLNEHTGGEGGD